MINHNNHKGRNYNYDYDTDYLSLSLEYQQKLQNLNKFYKIVKQIINNNQKCYYKNITINIKIR